ncbi:MAG: DUF1566 domain-containing protein, partial [Bacteroidales bacterium]|nr:DUF1566 domain-containing protein [Bacteroidales bacterium]
YSSLAMGDYTTASGRTSTALGGLTVAPSAFETAIGFFNTEYIPESTMQWHNNDRLFVIGNGTDGGSRSNALTILKNANTTIGGSLTINANGTDASITLPGNRGTNGQFMKTNADGSTDWANAVEPGTAPGQMQYWNGTAWVTVAAGQNGQTMIFSNGSPLWVYDYDILNHLNIGDYYQGGKIAYFIQPGDPGYDANVRHGLIAAPMDQSASAPWGCYGTTISGADGTALGTGAQNTLDIVAGCSTASIAAQICNDLVLNGYSDWYLPSKDELNKLYENKTAIGGFAPAYYWSSSEYSSTNPWGQGFSSGDQAKLSKNYGARVRAVRAF